MNLLNFTLPRRLFTSCGSARLTSMGSKLSFSPFSPPTSPLRSASPEPRKGISALNLVLTVALEEVAEGFSELDSSFMFSLRRIDLYMSVDSNFGVQLTSTFCSYGRCLSTRDVLPCFDEP